MPTLAQRVTNQAFGHAVEDPGRADRIRRYERRAKKGLPLFSPDTPREPSHAQEMLCWACGQRGPKGRHFRQLGWVVRRVRLTLQRATTPEVYCPDCITLWGWPEVSA